MKCSGVQWYAMACNRGIFRSVVRKGLQAGAIVVLLNSLALIAGRGKPWNGIGFNCFQLQSISFNYLDNSYLPTTLAVTN
jgi:hypothetical protein